MIDVPLENAINAFCSLFPQYFECAAPHRVDSTGQAKKKALKCNDTSSSHFVCQAT